MEKQIIVNCPNMTFGEMKDYCDIYQCEVVNTGVVGKYKLVGQDAHIVCEELNFDGFIE
jgi:hypothetical protein